MPFPLLAVAPYIISAVGAMLPAIVDAFRSGKSPEEAQKIIAPHRKEIVDRLIGTGMNQTAAEAMADQSMQGEFEKAQLPEPMNPWLQGALAIGGSIAGYKGGKMLAGKLGGKMLAGKLGGKVPVPEMAETSEAGEPPGLQDETYSHGFTSPRTEAMRRGAGDRVTGMGPPARIGYEAPIREVQAEVMRGPFPSPRMDPDFSALNMSGQVPGRNTRQFTMRDAGPFPGLGMSPEFQASRKAAEIERMWQMRDIEQQQMAAMGR